MSTKRIYRENQYAVSNEATVTGVRESGGCDVIACDESVFFPEGGGQPSDTGTVSFVRKADTAQNEGLSDEGRPAGAPSLFSVIHASDESLEGDVWHRTDAPAGTFAAGDRVTLTIDWDLRFRNMQRHLGEHMLSGTMDSLFGGVNRGFHIGDDYVTIDIDLDGRMLTDEELDLAERTVNEAIWSDLPVTVTWFDDYEASLVMPVRKQVPHDGRVSVVTVGDPQDPYDCIACCGVHPARSSEVGLLSVYKCDPNKGMNRIFFDCGKAAFDKLSSDSHTISRVAKRYSCSPSDLEGRLDIEAAGISELKARLAALSAYAKETEKERILKDINTPGRVTKTCTYTSEILSTDDLLKLGFSVINETKDMLLMMVHPSTHTCLLFSSGGAACGALVKEHAPEHNGRGGGRPDNARAIFTNKKDLDGFIEGVRQAVTASQNE